MSFLNLDLNLLRIFDAIMLEQNMTRAADRMAMTQPAVSNALKRMRQTLNDELLVRTAHGMKPTPRAEELWPSVRQALSGLEAAFAPENSSVAEARSTFRLAMADSTASLLLPPLMRAVAEDAPGLNVQILPLPTRDPRPMLLQNEIDFAVGSFPGIVAQLTADQGEISQIRHQQLYGGEYVCIMREHHPLATAELTLDRYCDALHVQVSFSGRAHGPADDALARLGRARRVALTVNQFFTVGQVVARSELISVVPRHLIPSIGANQTLVSRELPFELPALQVEMLWHERDLRNRPHRWMRDAIAEISSDEVKNIDTVDLAA